MGLLKKDVPHNREVMNEIAERLGIEGVVEAGDDGAAVEAMRKGFTERLEGVPKDDWIACLRCGEHTDDDEEIDRCPYCGDEGEGDETSDDTPEPVDIAEGEPESGGPEEPPAADLSEPETPATAETPAPETEDAAPPPEKPAPAEGKVKKGGKKAAAEKPAKAKKGGKKGTALATTEPAGEMAKALSDWKGKIVQAQKDMVGGSYDLGAALLAIHAGELWKAEGHKAFNKFLQSIGVSRAFAYEMMEIAKKFDRATFLEVGRKKLSIVARSAPEDQDDALAAAKGGASRREMEAAAKAAKEGEAAEGTDAAPPPEKPQSSKPAKESTITLLAKVGGRAASVKFRDRKSREPVKEWTADSYAEIQISENVTQFVALKTDKAGKIVGLTVAYRQAEVAEAAAE